MPAPLPPLPNVPDPPTLPDLPDIQPLSGEGIEGAITKIPLPPIPDFAPTSMLSLISGPIPPPTLSEFDVPGSVDQITVNQTNVGSKMFSGVMGQVIPLQMGLSALAVMVAQLAAIIGSLPGKPTLKLPVMPPAIAGDGGYDPFSIASLEAVADLVPKPTTQELLDESLDLVFVQYTINLNIDRRIETSYAVEIQKDIDQLKKVSNIQNVKFAYRLPIVPIFAYTFEVSLLYNNIGTIINEIEDKVIRGRFRTFKGWTFNGFITNETNQ